jgi:hypothetical protein
MKPQDLTVSYSSEYGEVKVVGTRNGIKALADLLMKGSGNLATDASGVDPSPYQMYLKSILVRRVLGCQVNLSVDSDRGVLGIAGGQDALGVMADDVRDFGENGQPDRHMHVDYYPEHFYLEPSEASLVIYLSEG